MRSGTWPRRSLHGKEDMSTETNVMTPEAQRIAIAEACGWQLKEGPLGVSFYYLPNTFPIGATPTYGLPDYLNSLDAMHEAEKLIEDDLKQCEEYGRQLIRIVLDVKTDGVPATYSGVVCVSRATAPQRAEAFLRTLNRWLCDSPT